MRHVFQPGVTMFNRIYIHVPFCVRKCNYCAFVSGTPSSEELAEYTDLLLRELHLHHRSSRPINSIYFGGGTPSLLQPEKLSRLLETIAGWSDISPDAEITLEANPGTVDYRQLKEFRDAGINRLSIGIQSFDDHFLELLGRIHTSSQSHQVFRDARCAGFNNISIDVMHSLPGQGLEQWQAELLNALSVHPEHISIYGLTVEKGTPFALTYPENSPALPDDDLSADMFELADELLAEEGFEHYEIANYARAGYRSLHNSGYWRRDGYLGLGVAAHSFLREGYGVRYSNSDTLAEYRQGVATGVLRRIAEHQLSQRDAMAEYIFLGLRLADGVRMSSFEREFGKSFESVYGPVAADLAHLGLVVQSSDMLVLTQRGMLLSNQVCARFI